MFCIVLVRCPLPPLLVFRLEVATPVLAYMSGGGEAVMTSSLLNALSLEMHRNEQVHEFCALLLRQLAKSVCTRVCKCACVWVCGCEGVRVCVFARLRVCFCAFMSLWMGDCVSAFDTVFVLMCFWEPGVLILSIMLMKFWVWACDVCWINFGDVIVWAYCASSIHPL